MTMTVEAIFENGVFVPAERPTLAEHERVLLTIETASRAVTGAGDAGVVATHRRRRTPLDPVVARAIAESPAFLPEER